MSGSPEISMNHCWLASFSNNLQWHSITEPNTFWDVRLIPTRSFDIKENLYSSIFTVDLKVHCQVVLKHEAWLTVPRTYRYIYFGIYICPPVFYIYVEYRPELWAALPLGIQRYTNSCSGLDWIWHWYWNWTFQGELHCWSSKAAEDAIIGVCVYLCWAFGPGKILCAKSTQYYMKALAADFLLKCWKIHELKALNDQMSNVEQNYSLELCCSTHQIIVPHVIEDSLTS